MPKIHYCENCQHFLEREGYALESGIAKPKKNCPLCNNEYKIFEMKNSYWLLIGMPICIFFGILFFIVPFLLINIFSSSIDIICSVIFLASLISIPYVGVMYALITILDYNSLIKNLQKRNPELKKGEILFKRTPSFFNPHQHLEEIIIYPNGIRAYFHETNKNGSLIPNAGIIKLVSNKDVKKIYHIQFKIFRESKTPTGFQLETKDSEICIIRLGYKSKDYYSILEVLKKCFNEDWGKIYKNRPLSYNEFLKLHKNNT